MPFATLSTVSREAWAARPDVFAMVIDAGSLETVESKKTRLRYSYVRSFVRFRN